ncbi:hypothetical protein N0V83_004988 [Neocucurbitaria cava]|uniref:Uncharacterized protein n=1 Tax=Neocucurbitaria cava TaxID=798079 RepID=A0A9W9CMK0_9PLEO|nr:hypothetical protein N0V83_004988 [Neocucurbitaria cava]
MTPFPLLSMRKDGNDESTVEETVLSHEAEARTQSMGVDQVLLKLNRVGVLAKDDLIPTHTIIENCLVKRLAEVLPHDLLFVGRDECTFKAPLITATAYSVYLAEGLKGKVKMMVETKAWPNYAVGLVIDHIINHAMYRVKVPLKKHEILYATNQPKTPGPAIPAGTAIAHVHLYVALLAQDWGMIGLLMLAYNALVQALAKPDQPTLDQFIAMIKGTEVFTEKYCIHSRTHGSHWLRQILCALGTYGAINHEIWMEQDKAKYLEFFPSAPYFAPFLLLCQSQLPSTVSTDVRVA